MTKAFLLIKAEVSREKDVLEKVKKIQEVEEAYEVYGDYDIIAKVVAENTDKLRGIVSDRIRKIDTINKTVTLVVVES